MIILRNEMNEIVEMFDTVAEFKHYLDCFLRESEKSMLANGINLKNGYLLTVRIDEASFKDKLDCYLDMTCETIETI